MLFAIITGSVLLDVSAYKGHIEPSPVDPSGLDFVQYDSHGFFFFQLLAMLGLLGAGFVSMVLGGYGVLGHKSKLVLIFYGISTVVWLLYAAATMSMRDFILDSNSPMVWLAIFGIFAGMRSECRRHVNWVVAVAAVATLVPAIYSITLMTGYKYTRFYGLSPMGLTFGATVWFALFVAIANGAVRLSLANVGWFAPLVGCGLLALWGQNRGWIVICSLGLLLFALKPIMLERRRGKSIVLPIVSGLVLVCFVWAVGFFTASAVMPMAVDATLDRLDSDSRSTQYVEFFRQVSPVSLILGLGPQATYTYENNSDFKYIDNQFIWMLFRGGVPVALGYTVLVLLPGWRLWFRAKNSMDYAAATILVLWTISLAGVSTFQSVGFNAANFFAFYLAGYCHARISELNDRNFRLGQEQVRAHREMTILNAMSE